MMAVVPVRDGVLPAGADETIAECGGRAVLAGSGTSSVDLTGLATEATLVELGPYRVARWVAALAPILRAEPEAGVVVLPASSDGRDLAPRLAAALGRPLLAGATEVGAGRVRVARRGGSDLVEHPVDGPVVVTLQPGVRGVAPPGAPAGAAADRPAVRVVTVEAASEPGGEVHPTDAEVVEVLPPDVATMDLAEAARIVGGGAGLDSPERFDELARFAALIGATTGATRVVTDRSWVPHERQIGTTGVVVDPELYVAFGISGAVQHTSGLGDPAHVVSVNVDAHCPMMQMSDLAIVSDANAVIEALLTRLTSDARTAVDG